MRPPFSSLAIFANKKTYEEDGSSLNNRTSLRVFPSRHFFLIAYLWTRKPVVSRESGLRTSQRRGKGVLDYQHRPQGPEALLSTNNWDLMRASRCLWVRKFFRAVDQRGVLDPTPSSTHWQSPFPFLVLPSFSRTGPQKHTISYDNWACTRDVEFLLQPISFSWSKSPPFCIPNHSPLVDEILDPVVVVTQSSTPPCLLALERSHSQPTRPTPVPTRGAAALQLLLKFAGLPLA